MKIDAKLISPVFSGRDPVDVKPLEFRTADGRLDPVVKTEEQQGNTNSNGKRVQADNRREELDQAAQRLNETAKAFNRALQFEVVNRDRIVVKVVDTQSGEVIREIPPEALVDAIKQVDKVLGLLLDRKV